MTRGGAGPYRKGAAFERETQKQLEAIGWVVVRSPASGSPFDLMGVRDGDRCILVQCKLGSYMRPHEWEELEESAAQSGCRAYLVGPFHWFSRVDGKIIEVDYKEV